MTEEHDDKAAADVLAKAPNEKKALLNYEPRKDFAWNPLKGWPRNSPCFCNSGKKAKLCCLPKQPPVIKANDAAALLKAMNMGEPGMDGIRAEYERHRQNLRKGILDNAKKELENREAEAKGQPPVEAGAQDPGEREEKPDEP